MKLVHITCKGDRGATIIRICTLKMSDDNKNLYSGKGAIFTLLNKLQLLGTNMISLSPNLRL